LAVTVLLGAGGGHWLDGKLGTAPWGLVLGVALGLASGFYNLYKVLMRPPQ
jgi:F0F1-type ATP synthase assembly protein I